MVFPDIDPVLIELGPFAIRWYALAYIAGLLLGWAYVRWLLRQPALWAAAPFNGRAPATPEDIDDLIVWATLGVIIGGRLGFVVFYGLVYVPEDYLANPLKVFAIWEGGMSFHGGALGVIVAVIAFCLRPRLDDAALRRALERAVRRRKADGRRDLVMIEGVGQIRKTRLAALERRHRTRRIDMIALGDLVAAAAPIGLFLGRIANFINGELYGRPTDGPFGMIFCNETIRRLHGGVCPAGEIPRHPSQLYEAALEGLVLFALLYLMIRAFGALQRPGLVIAAFLAGYGVFRTLVEVLFRQPDAFVGNPEAILTMGAILSAAMVAGAVLFLWIALRRRAA